MDRDIDLLEYLPGVLREIKEFRAITETENQEVVKLWDGLECVLNDQFVKESTINGIKRWEKILGIKPLDTDTLDERRFRILSRLNEQLPYTYKNLEEQLRVLCGSDGYRIIADTNAYALTVKVALTAKKKFSEVSNLLDRVVPCNILITLLIMYNQYKLFSQFTYEQIKIWTHKQLREDVI